MEYLNITQIAHFVQKYRSYHFYCKNSFVIFDITYVDAMKLLKRFQYQWIIVVYPEKCHSQPSSIRNIYVVYPQQIAGACGEWKHSYYVNLKGSKIYIPMSPYSKYCHFHYLCHLTTKYVVQKHSYRKFVVIANTATHWSLFVYIKFRIEEWSPCLIFIRH